MPLPPENPAMSFSHWVQSQRLTRVVVTGSLAWAEDQRVEDTLDLARAGAVRRGGSFRVLTGMADGADAFARAWARANDVQLWAEPLDAGPRPAKVHAYNETLLGLQPELVLAFKANFAAGWSEESCTYGTEHMCRVAARAGVPVLLNARRWLNGDLVPEQPAAQPSLHAQAPAPTPSQAPTLDAGRIQMTASLGDITKAEVDVVVNAANPSLLGGGGVDGAIHRAAGPALLEECRRIVQAQGGCETGDAVITGAGDLSARFIVHTVGPVWTAEAPRQHDEELFSCYAKSLALAADAGATSVAFPCISTGVYGFPKERAARVAIAAVLDCATRGDFAGAVTFVCFESEDYNLYNEELERSRSRR